MSGEQAEFQKVIINLIKRTNIIHMWLNSHLGFRTIRPDEINTMNIIQTWLPSRSSINYC